MASLARNAGATVEEIARIGNWRDRRMVERYAIFADETIEKAAAKLDRITSGLSQFITLGPSGSPDAEKPMPRRLTA